MVNNLRQSSRARKIMLAWRAQCADRKSESASVRLQAQPSREGISHLEEPDKEDNADDIALVVDMLRKQHAQTTYSTLRRSQLVEDYLQKLNLKMEDVYEVMDIGNSPDAHVIQNEVLYESEELWLPKTVSQCQNLLKKLKSEAENKEAHDKSNLHAEKSLNQEVHSNKNYDEDDEIEEKSSDNGNDQDIPVTGEPKTKKKKLSDDQKTLINKLKNALRSSTQLLAMVQGEAG